jgi:hypothetical protein
MTMPQDHTVLEILGRRDVAIWYEKADWIKLHSGIILLTVHPDYINTAERLRLFEQFLSYMMRDGEGWHALPVEIAKRWRQRDASSLRLAGNGYTVHGPAADGAAIIRASLENGLLKDEYLE